MIRLLTSADVAMLQKLSIATFTDTYTAYNTPQNMELYLSDHFSLPQLTLELEDKSSFFFGIFENDTPAGYVKLRTTEQPEALQPFKSIEIERIYVSKAYHGSGLGFALIEYSTEFAIIKGFEVIWLGVWQQNKKAIAFYQRQGFTIFSEHIFMLGTDPQTDWLMKKDLLV